MIEIRIENTFPEGSAVEYTTCFFTQVQTPERTGLTGHSMTSQSFTVSELCHSLKDSGKDHVPNPRSKQTRFSMGKTSKSSGDLDRGSGGEGSASRDRSLGLWPGRRSQLALQQKPKVAVAGLVPLSQVTVSNGSPTRARASSSVNLATRVSSGKLKEPLFRLALQRTATPYNLRSSCSKKGNPTPNQCLPSKSMAGGKSGAQWTVLKRRQRDLNKNHSASSFLRLLVPSLPLVSVKRYPSRRSPYNKKLPSNYLDVFDTWMQFNAFPQWCAFGGSCCCTRLCFLFQSVNYL